MKECLVENVLVENLLLLENDSLGNSLDENNVLEIFLVENLLVENILLLPNHFLGNSLNENIF